MNKSFWIPTLVCVIMLGTLSWLSVTVFNMNGTLSRVDTQVGRVVPLADEFPSIKSQLTSTSKRVDIIAKNLPLLQIRVAKEELSKPVKTAVVATNPRKNKKGS